jgi:UDP-glucuronate 4-epimerase
MEKILVTGSSGFIGFHLTKLLLNKGFKVMGVDSLNAYYDVNLKKDRNKQLLNYKNYEFCKLNLCLKDKTHQVVKSFNPDIVVHLAAQAGVRHSIDHPQDYVDSNLIATCNLLEILRYTEVQHTLIASTSSAYGASKDMPFKEKNPSNEPLTFYASTKRACELISHSYSNIFNMPITCFRFFTVYGPWGRPDMALFKFVKAILSDETIDVYNDGKMIRDFTYVEDLVRAIFLLLDKNPQPNEKLSSYDSISSVAPWRLVNIGNSDPVKLIDFVNEIENALGKKALINYMPLQIGDVIETYANTDLLNDITKYQPKTNYKEGIKQFVDWYRSYYS